VVIYDDIIRTGKFAIRNPAQRGTSPQLAPPVAGSEISNHPWTSPPAFLEALVARVAEREAQLAAAAAQNPRKLRDLLKSHARLKKILAQANTLARLQKDIREHQELIALDSTDPELKALAKEELAKAEKARPEAERIMLIELQRPNPNDERNAIMEIRAGTGGDEAALFAGGPGAHVYALCGK